MKRLFTLLAVLTVFLGTVSCNKMGQTYYRFDIDERITTGTNSTTDISAITKGLENRLSQYSNMNDAKAKKEWRNFVDSVDDSKVVIGTDEEYCTVSLVKAVYKESGDYETTSEVVAVIGKKTWRKSGAVEE